MGEMERTWKAGRIIFLRGLIEETMGRKTCWSILKGVGMENQSSKKRVECRSALPVVIGRKAAPAPPLHR